jgi:hypothetical protein
MARTKTYKIDQILSLFTYKSSTLCFGIPETAVPDRGIEKNQSRIAICIGDDL